MTAKSETTEKEQSPIFNLISNKPFNLIFGVSKRFVCFNIAVFFILTVFFDAFFIAVGYNAISYAWAYWISRTNPDIFNIFIDNHLFIWKHPIITGTRTWEA